jgi:hypothetical protein
LAEEGIIRREKCFSAGTEGNISGEKRIIPGIKCFSRVREGFSTAKKCFVPRIFSSVPGRKCFVPGKTFYSGS